MPFTRNRVSFVSKAAMGVNTAVLVVAKHGYICTTEGGGMSSGFIAVTGTKFGLQSLVSQRKNDISFLLNGRLVVRKI